MLAAMSQSTKGWYDFRRSKWFIIMHLHFHKIYFWMQMNESRLPKSSISSGCHRCMNYDLVWLLALCDYHLVQLLAAIINYLEQCWSDLFIRIKWWLAKWKPVWSTECSFWHFFTPLHSTVISLQARYVEVSSFIVTHVVLVSHSVTQSVIESEPRRVISEPAEG